MISTSYQCRLKARTGSASYARLPGGSAQLPVRGDGRSKLGLNRGRECHEQHRAATAAVSRPNRRTVTAAAVLSSPLLTQAFAAQAGEEIIPWSDQPPPDPGVARGAIQNLQRWEDRDWRTPNSEFLTKVLTSANPSRWRRPVAGGERPCVFGEASFAATRGMGQDAPAPTIPANVKRA